MATSGGVRKGEGYAGNVKGEMGRGKLQGNHNWPVINTRLRSCATQAQHFLQ